MASNHHHHPHHHQSSILPSDSQRRQKMTGEEKREALEREVAVLQQMLQQEEKTHDFLDKVHDHHSNNNHINGDHNASSGNIPIPSFLNPKAKELVSELVAVENEIGRLEGEISRLQHNLKQEQQLTKESTKPSSRQWQQHHHQQQHHLPPPTPIHHFLPHKTYNNSNYNPQDKLAFDTKALHFISKAIKGDYTLDHHDFPLSDKARDTTPNRHQRFREALLPDRADHHQHQTNTHRAAPKKSGMLFNMKSPSPMRDFRNPSPWPRDRNVENQTTKEATTPLPKALSNSILGEDSATGNVQHLQPNKLSENIMKCLNFIYVRLLRTSRAMELEKSGPISRSLNSSLVSRSFRADTGLLNSKTSSLSMYKESKQQDPYGIFDVEDSIPRDIGPYKNLVVFTSSSMDTKCISTSSSMPLIKKLRVLMNNLQNVDLRFLTQQQKLAFWINMYNACIMHGFLQFGVPHSPEKLLSLMNRATVNIGGNTINAQAIEHYILRKPTTSSNTKNKDESKESAVRKLYGLETTDPNVTFALCCGTRSSPAVKVYTAEGVTAELERAKLEYLQASMVVSGTKRISMPELLVRNLADFAMDTDTLVEWVCHQLPTSGSLRKSIVDCFRGQNSGKIPAVAVDKIPYDSQFQYLLAV
ncbi:unnamed protein product [Linum trigynum]|uniref:DUF547 domain-containing protein n=1 Tax=Linum trigynum TaxID=586398 RepID=A0AAV2G0Q8_9ROSI